MLGDLVTALPTNKLLIVLGTFGLFSNDLGYTTHITKGMGTDSSTRLLVQNFDTVDVATMETVFKIAESGNVKQIVLETKLHDITELLNAYGELWEFTSFIHGTVPKPIV